jgi:polyhydroxybutyrate depolymerase
VSATPLAAVPVACARAPLTLAAPCHNISDVRSAPLLWQEQAVNVLAATATVAALLSSSRAHTMEDRSAVDNHAFAVAILHKAVTADEMGNSDQALKLYQEGIEKLLAAVHEEQSEARQAEMRTRAMQCLDRAEELRRINRIEKGAHRAPHSPHGTCMPRRRLHGLFSSSSTSEYPPSASEPEQLWLRTADGRNRSVLLVVPDGEIGMRGRPLVVMLHGAGGSSRHTLGTSRWDLLAKREGFVVAVPDGTAPDESRAARFVGNPQTWNSCAGSSLIAGERSAEARGVDDVGFLVALIAEVGRRTRIDLRRVFLAGHSNGAGMAYKLASERPELIAAIGVVAGRFPAARIEGLSSPVSLLAICGERDRLAPLDGGAVSVGSDTGMSRPMRTYASEWARANGLADEPRSLREDAAVSALAWGPNAAGVEVRWLVVKGHGHAWPCHAEQTPRSWLAGLVTSPLMGPTSHALDATSEMWAFFKIVADQKHEYAAAVTVT